MVNGRRKTPICTGVGLEPPMLAFLARNSRISVHTSTGWMNDARRRRLSKLKPMARPSLQGEAQRYPRDRRVYFDTRDSRETSKARPEVGGSLMEHRAWRIGHITVTRLIEMEG